MQVIASNFKLHFLLVQGVRPCLFCLTYFPTMFTDLVGTYIPFTHNIFDSLSNNKQITGIHLLISIKLKQEKRSMQVHLVMAGEQI